MNLKKGDKVKLFNGGGRIHEIAYFTNESGEEFGGYKESIDDSKENQTVIVFTNGGSALKKWIRK